MKLEISRAKWLRGEGSDDSCLVRASDNKMCCLGFFGLACSIEADKMLEVKTPEEVPTTANETVRDVWTRKANESKGLFCSRGGGWELTLSSTCSDLMEANDDKKVEEEAREDTISKLFQKIGVEVIFVD